MKKTLITLSLIAGFLAYQVSAQTITVGGTSATGVAPGSSVNLTMQLSVGQALPTNVSGLNLLLETPTTGPNSGVGYFTVSFASGSTDFPQSAGLGSTVTSAFDTPTTSGPNSGFTVSTPTNDLGAGSGGGAGRPAPFTNVAIDMLKFTVDPTTPAGTYNFQATLGYPGDGNGSSVSDVGSDGSSANFGNYPVSNVTTFTITVVPEPATWSLIGLGGLGTFGLNLIRRRRLS